MSKKKNSPSNGEQQRKLVSLNIHFYVTVYIHMYMYTCCINFDQYFTTGRWQIGKTEVCLQNC